MSVLDDIRSWFGVKHVSDIVQTADAAQPATNPLVGKLGAAIQAAAPQASLERWLPVFTKIVSADSSLSDKRLAAALGQFSVEAGPGFNEIIEDTDYKTAKRLVDIFPREFPNINSTDGYVGNPQKIANRAYANKLGNGNEASGDGWTYRGRGMIQLTGRDEYAAYAQSLGVSPEAASAYCGTDEGAVASGFWYLGWRGCWSAADNWQIATITKLVNGAAMLDAQKRLQASNNALQALRT